MPRSQAWPLLLDIDTNELPTVKDAESAKSHPDHLVVERDVARSMWTFIPNETDRNATRSILEHLINALMSTHPKHIHYYQGKFTSRKGPFFVCVCVLKFLFYQDFMISPQWC